MSASNSKGYDSKGFDEHGYNSKGFDKYGYDREGYDQDGFNQRGYNEKKWDKNGLNKKGIYIADWECCGNPKHKDKQNPDPYRHYVEGKDRQYVDDVICDVHAHSRCLGDAGGCKRMYDPERERPKPVTPFSDSASGMKASTPPPFHREALARVNSSSSFGQGRGV